jgi:hypothetical protein
MSTRKLIVKEVETDESVDLQAFAEAYARALIAEAQSEPRERAA